MSPQHPLRPPSAAAPSAPLPAKALELSLMSMTLLFPPLASLLSPAPAPPLAPPAAPGTAVPGRAVARSVNNCFTLLPVFAEHSRNMTPSLRALRRPSSLLTTLHTPSKKRAGSNTGNVRIGAAAQGGETKSPGETEGLSSALLSLCALRSAAPQVRKALYPRPHLRSARSVLFPTSAIKTSVPRSARTSSSQRDASSKDARDVTS